MIPLASQLQAYVANINQLMAIGNLDFQVKKGEAEKITGGEPPAANISSKDTSKLTIQGLAKISESRRYYYQSD